MSALRIANFVRSRAFASWLLLALCITLFLAENRWSPAPFSFEAEVQTTAATRLRLFYDTGAGFNLHDSATLLVDTRGGARELHFPIAARQVRELRLVEVDLAEPLTIARPKLRAFGGGVWSFGTADIVPDWHIASTQGEGETLRFLGTPGTSDLAVRLKLATPVYATSAVPFLRWFVVALLGIAATASLLLPSMASEPARVPKTAVVALLTLAFVLAIAFKLNGSSTAFWRLITDREAPDRSLVAGTPKEIRSDEWMIQTPWIVSQLEREPRLGLTNPNVGDGPAPLLTNLPARHWTVLFRPQMWGFLCLPNEYSFALYWNFKWYALLLGAFLFLEVITGGRVLLSLAGAVFLLAAPYIQWWFSTPTCMPEMLAMLFFSLWSIAVVFRTASKWKAVAAAIILLFALLQFVLCCYPRFQIPLGYVALLLLVSGAAGKPAREFRLLRFACFGGTLLIALALLSIWYGEVAGLIHRIAQLKYPGQMLSTGGDFPWLQLFAPFLEYSMTEQNYPRVAMNVCEAAGFLFIAPLLLALFARDAIQRRVDRLFAGCVIGAVLLLIFMLAGIPVWLARASGWSQVYGARALLPLGIVSTVGLFRYLSRDVQEARRARDLSLFCVLGVALVLLLQHVNVLLQRFTDLPGVCAAAVFFALVTMSIWSHRVTATCTLLVIPLLVVTGLTNPINKGLRGLTRSSLRGKFAELQHANPAAKWLVLSRSGRGPMISHLIESTGAPVLGSARITPDDEMLRVLDPTAASKEITERYANISFVPSADTAPRFELTFINSYTIHLPLRPELFDALQVSYIVEVDLPDTGAQIAGFTALATWQGCRVFARATH